MSIDDKIKEIENHKEYRAQFIRDPIRAKDDSDWRMTANQWLIIFPNGCTTDFFTGSAHREFKYGGDWDKKTYEDMKHRNLTPTGFEKLMASSKATKPKLKDVLYSMVTDSYAANTNFNDWCADYGYNDDSMKALETYKACIQSAGVLRGLGFNDLTALQEYFQDY